MRIVEQAHKLLGGLGGIKNVVEVEPCSTRVRVVVRLLESVDSEALHIPGVFGIVMSGHVVQIVAGSVSDDVAFHMQQKIDSVCEMTN